MCRAGHPIRLSEDHKPDNEEEFLRIINGGGRVLNGRVNGNLNLSRALGDFQFKRNTDLSDYEQLIIAKPDIAEHTITGDDEFILIGCDGIWETKSDQVIVNFIRSGIVKGTSLD